MANWFQRQYFKPFLHFPIGNWVDFKIIGVQNEEDSCTSSMGMHMQKQKTVRYSAPPKRPWPFE